MQNVSDEYKEIMKRNIRNRGFISVGIGLVNNEAQKDGSFSGDISYWSNVTSPFLNSISNKEYATMENDFTKADGSMFFMPKEDEGMMFLDTGISSADFNNNLRIDFANTYDIKGLTLNFGDKFPSSFTIHTDNGTVDFTNTKKIFETEQVFSEITFLEFKNVAFPDNKSHRLRIKSVLMGLGLNYGNEDIKSSNVSAFVSPISEDLPTIDFNLSIFDPENLYDVDNNNSYVNFLDALQKIKISYGLELDNGNIEWVKCGTLFLKEWNSTEGEMNFSATDRLFYLSGEYSLGNKIYTRTAYQEAESIFSDAGLEADEYAIDESLKDITLTNPVPVTTHAQALQLIANISKCVIKQDVDGRIVIRANFANIIEPTDINLSTNDSAEWSKIDNIRDGSTDVYADLTKNFFKVDASQFFLPETAPYTKNSGYVSKSVADSDGLFITNPTITMTIPAAHSYYGIVCNFDGNPPKEIIVHSYSGNTLLEDVKFTSIKQKNVFNHDFIAFDKLVFEFTKATPNNRILINHLGFGNYSDYRLTKNDMMDYPKGYKEEVVSNVKVKIYTFENDEQGNPQEVEDDVFYNKVINLKGNEVEWKNPLISTEAQAITVAEWLGNHYKNNILYNVNFRGDPKLNASDIIYMDSRVYNNLQVEIQKNEFSFDGSFSGKLELRRALSIIDQNQ